MALKQRKPREPDDEDIVDALKAAVTDARASGKLAELSVKAGRTYAEEKLGLSAGFLKSNTSWTARSKQILQDAINNEEPSSSAPITSDNHPTLSPVLSPPSKKRANGGSRAKPVKRRKTSSSDDESATGSDANPPKKAGTASRKTKAEDDSDTSELSRQPTPATDDDAPTKPSEDAVDSESELSELIDEPAPKKKRKSKGEGKVAKPKESKPMAKTAKQSKDKDADLSPDEIEIKRLQGWLVKCGIRKLWHKELAGQTSSKGKIKHLKGMLDDVGMTGRYSQEKATAIKERRELAAELEAVQEGEKTWGDGKGDGSESEEENAPSPPRRRPAAASRFIDFGSDEDDDD